MENIQQSAFKAATNKPKTSKFLFNKTLMGVAFSEWASYKEIFIGLIFCSLFINILALVFPLSLLQIYDRIIPNKSNDTLYVLCLGIITIMSVEALLRVLRIKVSTWMDARLSYKASLNAFKHLLFADIHEYDKYGAGVHMERMNNLDSLKDFYGGQMIITIIDLPFLILFLGLITYISGTLVIVPLIMIALIVLTIMKSTRAAKSFSGQEINVSKTRLNFLVEILNGIYTIKSLAMEEQILRRYERLQEARISHGIKTVYKQAEINRVISFYSQANMVVTVGFGALYVFQGNMTMGGLAACTLLSGRSIIPVAKFMNLWNRFQTIHLASEGQEEILAIPKESSTSIKLLPEFSGYLFIDNVSLKYQGMDHYTLKEITLNVPFGDCIGITGGSESGKTTLISILDGLLPPTKGRVMINGRSIYDYNLQHIRQHIGYLPQQSNIFDGSILENISLFRHGKYIDNAKQVINKLGLNHEIELMKAGYDTKIGVGSTELVSKGFRQGLVIARILANDPSIILFDEANDAMDIASDSKLMGYLQELKGSHTIFLVSSRPSTLKLANRVYYLHDGYLKLRRI